MDPSSLDHRADPALPPAWPSFQGFLPWIGPQYGSSTAGEPRILVLGESHWGNPNCRYPEFTRDVVRRAVFEGRDRFFTKVAKLVRGVPVGAYLDTPSYRDFWNRVVFYNYVQELVGPTHDCRPAPAQWETGKAPFLQLIREQRPQAIVVLGKELWANLPSPAQPTSESDAAGQKFEVHWYDCGQGQFAAAAWVNHPSSWGWRYQPWPPRVARLLHRAVEGRD